MYDLRLDIPVGSFHSYDLEAKKVDAENLQKLTTFRDKLIYFNENIKSLSLYNSASKVFIEWSKPGQILVIYDGSKKGRALPGFNSQDEQVFLEIRSKEVERLQNEINKQKSFRAKLSYLFATKGYRPEGRLSIYPNVEYSAGIDPDLELMYAKPAIDLEPENKEQIIIYNSFIKDQFDKKYRRNDGYSEAYKCFDFEKERQKFEVAYSVAIVPEKLVDYLKNRIETYFGYPENLDNKHRESDYQQNLSARIEEESGLITKLFLKKMIGSPIDLDKNKLTEHALLDYTHVSEVVKFYSYIKQAPLLLKEGRVPKINKPDTGDKVEYEITLQKIKASENQFWKGLPMDVVVSHFEVLSTRKNKNGQPYLTKSQLISFLKKGFLHDKDQPKQKITCTNGEKGFMISRFYELFTLAVSQYGCPSRKARFINLFIDCFDNWDENTIPTFFKPNRSKEKW